MRQGCLLSPLWLLLLFSSLSFGAVLEILANAAWQREDIKSIHIGKVKVKLPDLFMTWSSTHKILRTLPEKKKPLVLISEFAKLPRYRLIKIYCYFHILARKREIEIKKIKSLMILSKQIKCMGLNLTKEVQIPLKTKQCWEK